MRARPTLPAGQGELLLRPGFEEWARLLERNRAAMAGWDFAVAGLEAGTLRALARRETLAAAVSFSGRLGVPLAQSGPPEAPIIATGHQPELYHPGVWAKCFLLQRLAREAGATAVDIVVDSDGFDVVGVDSPRMTPRPSRCRQYLAVGTPDGCFACAPSPDERTVEDFCRATAEALSTLPAPSISQHFTRFCAALESAIRDAHNLAEAVTFARRRYEASADTDYLELPVTSLARGEAFARFAAAIALNARRFATDYNAELAEFRSLTGVRSQARPFPDLIVEADRAELPLWSLSRGRSTVWARLDGEETVLEAQGEDLARLPSSPDAAVATLLAADLLLAPKALTLTMFTRLFCCDLFIHGVGGGRYDQVTDGVIRRHFGVQPPGYVVASMTLYLPLGAHVVKDEEIAQVTGRLNRLKHNPDAMLGEVEFDSAEERSRALALAAEKRTLVDAIGKPGADKKALGSRIREINEELGAMLEPVRVAMAEERERLIAQRADTQVLTDRTYPFCFWNPVEVAEKVW